MFLVSYVLAYYHSWFFSSKARLSTSLSANDFRSSLRLMKTQNHKLNSMKRIVKTRSVCSSWAGPGGPTARPVADRAMEPDPPQYVHAVKMNSMNKRNGVCEVQYSMAVSADMLPASRSVAPKKPSTNASNAVGSLGLNRPELGGWAHQHSTSSIWWRVLQCPLLDPSARRYPAPRAYSAP